MTVGVKKDSGAIVSARGNVDLIAGSNITLTVVDATGGLNEIDITIAAAGVEAATIFDAKGDLAVGTGADTATKLAVSTNQGYGLVVDGSTSTGLAWQQPWWVYDSPTGALAQTFSRLNDTANSTTLTTQRMNMSPIFLPSNLTITSISFLSGTTALATGSNQWFALYDSSRNLLRQTTNDTSTAWAANTVKTLNLTSTYTTTANGLFYLGIMVHATTVPTMIAISSSNVVRNLAPILNGLTSDTGLTDTAPNPAGAITVGNTVPYAYVS